MSASGITREEWLAAIHENDEEITQDESALTVREFAELAGREEKKARRMLMDWEAQGKAQSCHKLVIRSDGQRRRVQAYRLLSVTNGSATTSAKP